MLHDKEASIMLWMLSVCTSALILAMAYWICVTAKPQHCPDKPFAYPNVMQYKQEVVDI